MKVKSLKAKLGIAVLLTVFSLNTIYAFNDYGVTTNKLHNEILLQRNGSSGGSGGGGSVDCCCGAIWGNGCKANNYGSTCLTTSEQCWTYNQNCN